MSKIFVTVTRPELTVEEKNKRIEELKKATADFMKAVEKERSSKDEKSN